MDQAIIQFNHVSKAFDAGRAIALSDISFEVSKGNFVCIVGPSGCGKSTVLKIIAGLEVQSSGEVKTPGNVAMVFQNGALLPWLTVFENVAFGLVDKGYAKRHIELEVVKYIEMMGLQNHTTKYPRELSGGQRQRVGIARALAVKPETLILDEPFSALDTATTEELHRDLLKIWRDTGQTIVMVSHSIEEAVNLADKIILMQNRELKREFFISLPRPRREQASAFMQEVQEIRKSFL